MRQLSATTFALVAAIAAALGLVFAAYSTYDYAEQLDRRVHAVHCSFIPGLPPATWHSREPLGRVHWGLPGVAASRAARARRPSVSVHKRSATASSSAALPGFASFASAK
jgi:hypothetical protein